MLVPPDRGSQYTGLGAKREAPEQNRRLEAVVQNALENSDDGELGWRTDDYIPLESSWYQWGIHCLHSSSKTVLGADCDQDAGEEHYNDAEYGNVVVHSKATAFAGFASADSQCHEDYKTVSDHSEQHNRRGLLANCDCAHRPASPICDGAIVFHVPQSHDVNDWYCKGLQNITRTLHEL